ncbi:hypothetical protein ABT337_29700 [Saccharopolyspora hirsuta]
MTAVTIPSDGASSATPSGPGTTSDTTTNSTSAAPSTAHTTTAGR